MESKHTPGPWTLEAGRAFSTASGRFYLAYGADKGTGRPHFDSPTELDANARLIAAAPGLLAALRELSADHERHCGYACTDDRDKCGNCTAARAAIAKATGSES